MLHVVNRSFSLAAIAVCVASMESLAITAPILDPYGTSLTAHPPIASNEAGSVNVGPRFDQRATDIDGSLRASSPLGWTVAADTIGGGYTSGRMLGDVNLATGSYHPNDIDLALPTLGLPVVIGRTYNLLQQNTGTRGDVINAQGWNWSQTAQPQIALVPGSTSDLDVLYLVFGADRFVEFKRTGTSASEFKSKNGAAGVVQFTAGSGTVPELYTYHDPSSNQITFFGFNTAAGDAKGQLWKMADAQGHVAYAHDETSAATAASGYTDGLVQAMYDESGRRYIFTYATVGEFTMLATVQAQINASGWTTVAQVDYTYYNEEDLSNGLPGDLKLVTIAHKGVSGGDYVRRKYYRYYTGEWADTNGARGQEHALKMVVGFDGVRQYDPTGTTFYSETDEDLKPYAEAYFEYVSGGDYRVKAVTFNGECGCGGGSSGEYALAYADASSYSTMVGNTAYDNAWARRTVITQPDGNYVTQYFDETGAVLSRVLSTYNPSTSLGTSDKKWVTGIVRNSSGQVTAVHSPANITGYTHSTGSINTSTSAGLVTYFTRFASSGNLDGLRSGVTIREGTSGSEITLNTITASDHQMLIGSTGAISIAQIDSSSTYPEGSALTTSYSYTYWSTTNTDQSYLSAKSIQTTNPTVSTTKNGSGSETISTRYLRKDRTTAFSKDAGEIVSYMGRSAFGQIDTQIADCNPSTIADIKDEDKASGANLWGLSSLAGTPIHAKTTMTYDDQGRLTSSTQPSYGTSGSTTRTSVNVYVLDNAQLGTMSFSRKVSSTYYGPARYSRVNHAGKVDRQTTIQIASSGTTTVPGTIPNSTDWSGMVDQVYDLTGMRHSETRTYTTGTSTYDSSSKHYDNMGRLARTVDVTGTIRRTVFDARGLPTERWIGTDDSGWTNPSGSGLAANMVATEIMEYDDGYQPESQMKNAFRFTEGNSSTYNTYMDRFNRPIKQLWRRDISGTVDPKVVDWDLAYDLAGNEVTLQDNVLLDANSKRHFDRIDSFDALRRMTKREEGKVVSSAIASGDRSRMENTTRNLAGRITTDQVNLNWSSTDTDYIDTPPAIDAGEMNDARTYNKRNELVSRTYNDSDNPTTPKPVYPLYDLNGNMISDGETHTYKYNVWCQLSEIRLGLTELATLMVEYRYNGLGQRIAEHPDTNSSSNDGVADGVVDANDPWFYLAVDTQGRRLATFRGSDTYPKETFVYHQPGVGARGGTRGPAFSGGILARFRNASLYDPTKLATEAGSSTRSEQTYYCSDHRGNVVATVDTYGYVEQYRYSPSGVPFGIPRGDVNADGIVDDTDLELVHGLIDTSDYQYRADANLDGTVGGDDFDIVQAKYGTEVGRGSLSDKSVRSDIGYRSALRVHAYKSIWVNHAKFIDPTLSVLLSSSCNLWTNNCSPVLNLSAQGTALFSSSKSSGCGARCTMTQMEASQPLQNDVDPRDHCQACIDNAITSDPIVKSLIERVYSNGCGIENLSSMCRAGSCGGMPGSSRHNRSPEGPGSVFICISPLTPGYPRTCEFFTQVLRHELVHAVDHCSGRITDVPPGGTINQCMEMRACVASRQCEPGGADNPDGSLDWLQCCKNHVIKRYSDSRWPPPPDYFLERCANTESPWPSWPSLPAPCNENVGL